MSEKEDTNIYLLNLAWLYAVIINKSEYCPFFYPTGQQRRRCKRALLCRIKLSCLEIHILRVIANLALQARKSQAMAEPSSLCCQHRRGITDERLLCHSWNMSPRTVENSTSGLCTIKVPADLRIAILSFNRFTNPRNEDLDNFNLHGCSDSHYLRHLKPSTRMCCRSHLNVCIIRC